ncbi:MAG: RsmD family RNA methyltransferase [Bacteroidota bacterium]
MRIISGKFRSRLIKPPKGLPVRPTTDFAKTGLFNILSSRFDFSKVRVADLYAGTGSLSYEFVSRGCEQLVSVDRSPDCIRFIRQTMLGFNAPKGVFQSKSDVLFWLDIQQGPFDILVADPPFAETPAEELVHRVFSKSLLSPNGMLIIEHASTNDLSAIPGFSEARRYGSVSFSFFRL